MHRVVLLDPRTERCRNCGALFRSLEAFVGEVKDPTRLERTPHRIQRQRWTEPRRTSCPECHVRNTSGLRGLIRLTGFLVVFFSLFFLILTRFPSAPMVPFWDGLVVGGSGILAFGLLALVGTLARFGRPRGGPGLTPEGYAELEQDAERLGIDPALLWVERCGVKLPNATVVVQDGPKKARVVEPNRLLARS